MTTKFTAEHEWLTMEDGSDIATVGITVSR